MARTDNDICNDIEVLDKLHIGDRVRYISKTGIEKTGNISKITEYRGRYGSRLERREYYRYSSVTVALDDGKSHVNVSPRNLQIIQ